MFALIPLLHEVVAELFQAMSQHRHAIAGGENENPISVLANHDFATREPNVLR